MTASGGDPNGPATRERLTIDLDRDTEPISGFIEAGPGTGREFTGLIELVSLIDRLRNGPADPGESRE